MNNKKLSLLFTVSLTAIGSIHSSAFVWNNALARHINTVTGRIVKSKGVLLPYGGIEPFSAIEQVASEAKAGRSFFDGSHAAMVAAGITAGVDAIRNSEDSEQSVVVEQPSVVIEQPSTGSASTTSTVSKFTLHPYMAYSIAVVAGATARNIWNVYKAKSKIAEAANVKQDTTTEEIPAVVVNTQGTMTDVTVVNKSVETQAFRVTETLKPVVAPKQATPAPVVKPAAVETVVARVAPVVKQAQAPVAKQAVNDIVRNNAGNPSEMIKVLKAHGFTRAHVSEETLKQLGKLNDGQMKFFSKNLK